MDAIEKTVSLLKVGASSIIPMVDLVKKLESGKKLIIKLGMDPTSADLHLGHAVVLSKLKQFQDLGHEVFFLIGDFTARIGDPTGRSKTRPPLTTEQIEHNMKTYFEQVGKILDIKRVNIVYNSHWLGSLSSADILQLCGKVTVARLIEREDFASRLADKKPIGMHELFYPLLQGYDSVELNADLEIGGTDQTFNLLMGRFLQEQYGKEPQVVLTMPLLEGLDGTHKMSKSLGNAIGLAELPDKAFGKLMSITDELMWRYYELLLLKTSDDIAHMKEEIAQGSLHPKTCKKNMAYGIIERFWSKKEADQARDSFEAVFEKRDYSNVQEVALPLEIEMPIWIVDLLKIIGAITSSSEAKRLIESGAVVIDQQQIKDFKARLEIRTGTTIKVGKHRIYRIR